MNISLYLYHYKSLESKDRQSDNQDPTTFPSRPGKKYDLSVFLQSLKKRPYHQPNRFLSAQVVDMTF